VYIKTEEKLGDSFVKCTIAKNVVDDDPPCSSNTALYVFSIQQYLICCLTYSIAKPFRKPIYKNPLFSVSVIVMVSY